MAEGTSPSTSAGPNGESVYDRLRANPRYFFDTRRKTSDPETEGYGYRMDLMFEDLERLRDAAQAVHEGIFNDIVDAEEVYQRELRLRAALLDLKAPAGNPRLTADEVQA